MILNIKRMKRLELWSLCVLLVLSACAQLKPASQAKSEATPTELSAHQENQIQAADQTSDEQLATVEAQLQALVKEAKGTEAESYLAGDLFFKATDAAIRGDSATAIMLYKHLVLLNPSDAFLKQKYAVELIKAGKLQESLSPLQEVFVQQGEKDETTGLILGGVYSALEMNNFARKIYQKVLVANPGSEEACIFLAKAQALDKHFDAAEKLLGDCAKRSENKSIFHYYQGKIAIGNNSKQKAKQYFQLAWKADRSFYQAALALGLMEEEQAKFSAAANIYKQFLDVDPNNGVILERIVNIYFAEGKFQEVIPFAERLSQIDAQNLNLKVKLGILYTEAKQLDQAIGIFKEILAEAPESDKILYYLGSLFQQKGELENALDYFSKIPTSSALYHDSSLQMAQLLYAAIEQYSDKEAISVAYKRLESFVHDRAQGDLRLELNMILADFHEGKGDVKKAIDIVQSVKSEQAFTENHVYYLASLYEKTGELNSARELVKDLLKQNPDNAHALNFLGYSYIEQEENMAEAYQMISKAASLKPDDGYIRDSLGWYYYKAGDLQKALREISRARELVQTDMVITKHLAIVYQALKSYDKAKQYLMEALKHCKVDAERDEVLRAIELLRDHVKDQRLPASR